MHKKQKELRILFNASVILAGLKSPLGASGELIKWVRSRKVKGIVSELILDEAVRHADKIGFSAEEIRKKVSLGFEICPAPEERIVEIYKRVVIDFGDAHVLAAAAIEKCGVLITLDKKHLLVLKGKVKGLRILSPGELLISLRSWGGGVWRGRE